MIYLRKWLEALVTKRKRLRNESQSYQDYLFIDEMKAHVLINFIRTDCLHKMIKSERL